MKKKVYKYFHCDGGTQVNEKHRYYMRLYRYDNDVPVLVDLVLGFERRG